MANIQSAKKRARQTIKKNELKSSQRASVRTAIKSVEQAIEAKDKVKATLYDISDDCTYKSKRNYTLNHLIERIKIYNEENFNYEIITIQLKK